MGLRPDRPFASLNSLRHLIFLGVPFLLLLYGVNSLIHDFESEQQDARGDVIARVRDFAGDVKRRANDRFRWFVLSKSGSVFARDSIRTVAGSRVVLEFRDGSELEIGENSLIYLQAKGSEVELKFVRGRAKIKGKTTGITIRTAAPGPSIRARDTDAEIDAGDSSGLNVSVVRGTLEVLPTFTAGRTPAAEAPKVVKQIQVSSTGETSVAVEVLRAVLPEPGAWGLAGNPVKFEWSGTAKELLISRRMDFKSSDRVVSVTGSSTALTLEPGHYFWKLRSGDTLSPVRPLIIYGKNPPELTEPKDGALIWSDESEAEVRFRWKGEPYLERYVLEVAEDAQFAGKVQRTEVAGTEAKLTLESIRSGYWRVVGESPQNRLSSSVRAIGVITKRFKPSDFKISLPKENAVSRISEPVIFEWSGDPIFPAVWLGIPGEFRVKVSQPGGKGRYVWNTSKAGKFEWSLEAGRARTSGTVEIRAPIPELVLSPPRLGEQLLSEVAQQAKRLEGAQNLVLGWKPVSGAEKYLVVISRKRDLTKPVENESTHKTEFEPRESSSLTGHLYYQIQAVLTNGDVAKSAVGDYLLLPAAPTLGFPVSGEKISRSKLASPGMDRIILSWKQTAFAAAYEVELALDPGFKRKLWTRKTERNFVVVESPKLGVYWWRVKSMTQSGARTPANATHENGNASPRSFTVEP